MNPPEPFIADRSSPVYDEVLIALTITPKRVTQLRREVERQLKRKVPYSTITRALSRAQEHGAALETVLGWAEPIDDLTPTLMEPPQ